MWMIAMLVVVVVVVGTCEGWRGVVSFWTEGLE